MSDQATAALHVRLLAAHAIQAVEPPLGNQAMAAVFQAVVEGDQVTAAAHTIHGIASLHVVPPPQAVASHRVVSYYVPDYWEPRNPTVAQQRA